MKRTRWRLLVACLAVASAAIAVAGGNAGNRTAEVKFDAFPGPASVTYKENIAYRVSIENTGNSTFTQMQFRQRVPVATVGTTQFPATLKASSCGAVVLDGLIYFRRLDSAVRPYLGTGISVTHFSSDVVSTSERGLAAPVGEMVSTRIGLRSHVGIDLRLSRHTSFRYSFSETISGNPISAALTPPGGRGLMNFQNLFGFLTRF